MKIKKNVMMTALAFSAAINLNGCVYGPPYDPSHNVPQPAYGPPPVYTSTKPDAQNDNIEDNSENSSPTVFEEGVGTDNTSE